ncbi:MAG: HAMP domain-containing protein [Candidatus Staskawiczbacteria bacterium]|nr:HAMP domain-containing protein [Candidatus Staskawiczbacteria bacterium]
MEIFSVSFKIAVSIIITGIFIVSVFIALNYERLDINFYIVFTLITVYVFLFGFATGQRFATPVRRLLKRATDLSEGDLTTKIYFDDKGEFNDLAKALNKIADELKESRSKAETTEKSVDIKVKARTQALEETINALEQKVKNRTLELQRIIDKSELSQNQIKNKESEINQLKREMGNLKKQLSG